MVHITYIHVHIKHKSCAFTENYNTLMVIICMQIFNSNFLMISELISYLHKKICICHLLCCHSLFLSFSFLNQRVITNSFQPFVMIFRSFCLPKWWNIFINMQILLLETGIVLSGLQHRADTVALFHFMFWNILFASLALCLFKKLLSQSLLGILFSNLFSSSSRLLKASIWVKLKIT